MHNPMTIIIPKPSINMHKEIEGTVIDGNMLINQTSQESHMQWLNILIKYIQ